MLNADLPIRRAKSPHRVACGQVVGHGNKMRSIRLLLIVAASLMAPVRQNASGQETSVASGPIASTEKKAKQPVTGYLNELQLAHESSGDVFVEMDDLNFLIREGGGGSCASAAALIVLQTCRSACQLPPVTHPHRVVLESMKDQKALLNGRVNNNQFAKLIQFYSSHQNGHGADVSILSAPNSPHAN
ncbi:MAG: hypothetical protein ACF787_12940, partial [Rhodopirellula sp. JB053]